MNTKIAVLAVNVSKFRPVGVVLTSATLQLIEGDPNYFSTDGKNIRITIPKNPPKDLDIELAFQVNAADYLLVGLAFNKTKFEPSGEGATEFPLITITRKQDPIVPMNELRVRDARVLSRMGVSYDYYLLIQEVASGAIGVIDPPIDTNGGD